MLPTRLSSALALLVLVACGDPPPPPAPVAPPPPPPPPPTLDATSFTLENGLAVELVRGACGDDAAVALLHGAGLDHDPAGRSGLSRLVLGLRTTAAGANRTVTLGRDVLVESARVPAAGLLDAIDATAAHVRTPELTEEGIAAARAALLAELAARRGGDADLAAVSFATESMMPARGGGWIGGVEAEIGAITAQDVAAHWTASTAPSASRLVVVGDFDVAAVRARVEAAFGPLAAATAAPIRDANEASVSGTLVFGDAPTSLAVGVRAPPIGDPLYPAFVILASRVLGPAESRSFTATYDPVVFPELLVVAAHRDVSETPDAAAVRVRNETMSLLSGSATEANVDAALERFGLLLGAGIDDPSVCAQDPRALAVARARRASLGVEGDLSAALSSVSDEQLDEVRPRFSAERSAAVVTGGTIR